MTSISQRVSGNPETNSTSSASTSDPTDATWIAPRVTSFNNDSIADKSLQLRAMFPEIKEFDVGYALKKCNNDFQSALEHLLNMQYLEETGQQTKGIDGFAQLEEPRKQRKGKGKGRKREPSPDTKRSVPAELIREAKGMVAYFSIFSNAPTPLLLTGVLRANRHWLHCRTLQSHL